MGQEKAAFLLGLYCSEFQQLSCSYGVESSRCSSKNFCPCYFDRALCAKQRSNSNGTREGSVILLGHFCSQFQQLSCSYGVESSRYNSSNPSSTSTSSCRRCSHLTSFLAAAFPRLYSASESPTSKTQHSGRFCMISFKKYDTFLPPNSMKFD